jgi:perosamine synthetase
MKIISHNLPTLGRKEIQASKRVVKSKWLSASREVARFERELETKLEVITGSVVAVSSGSAALFVALQVIGAKGKEVKLPNYSCGSLRNSIKLVSAIPHFLDCEKNSPNVDYEPIVNSNSPIICVSNFGQPATVPRNQIQATIEDFSQSFGAKSHNKFVGTRTLIGICSTSTTKMFTTGGSGGFLVTQDLEFASEIRNYINFDQRIDSNHFNFQLSEVQAAIGRAQLKKVDQFIEKREEIWQLYKASGIPLIEKENQNEQPVRFRAVLKTQNPKKLINHLGEFGVKAIVPYETRELGSISEKFKNSVDFANETVSIPIYPDLKLKDVRKIASLIHHYITS